MIFLNKKLKFCCESFKSYYETGPVYENGVVTSDRYPNIKVVKQDPKTISNHSNPLRFFIVSGFLKDSPPKLLINNCPFCGIHLYTFYKGDKYINGDESL